MAHELTWSPAARLDLKEIFAYIAEDDPIAGKKFIRSLFMAVERLSVFPESGRVVPEFKGLQRFSGPVAVNSPFCPSLRDCPLQQVFHDSSAPYLLGSPYETGCPAVP
jgi:plasmid stabilization system protein ParE